MLRLKKLWKQSLLRYKYNNLFFFFINLCFKQKEIQDSKLLVVGPLI